MFKKTLLGSAIVAAMGISSIAQAHVNLDSAAADNGSITYASEITVAPTGKTLTDAGDAGKQDLNAQLGFSINNESSRFIRIDLSSGAEFTDAPALNITDIDDTPATVDVNLNPVAAIPDDADFIPNISDGGAGESFVIFEVTAGENLAPDDIVTVVLDGLTVVSQASVTASYALFETGTAAANAGVSLASASQVAYRFAPGLSAVARDAGELEIDVATLSTKFTDDKTVSPIANLAIGPVTDVLGATSDQVTLADLVAEGTKLVIGGDFSAVAVDTLGKPTLTSVKLGGVTASTLTATAATFLLNAGALPAFIPNGGSSGTGLVTMEVTGKSEIIAGDYTALYDVVPDATTTTADRNLGVVGTLEKNGSSATANLVLTPSDEGGAFRNFVRISNTSSIAGTVSVRIWNDLGESVAFPLGDVADQESLLGAQESTSLINIDDLFATAVAADATFAIGTEGRNKLRIAVEGQFTSIGLDNVTVSRDNQSFSTFQ